MTVYNEAFYQQIGPQATRSAERIVPLVMDLVHPKSVVDIGCGTGGFLRAFKQHGVKDVLGLEGAWAKPEGLSSSEFMVADLAEPFQLSRTFDLAVSLEVAEHLPETSATEFVECLTQAAPRIVFSAAVPGQGGTNHVNEQWPNYWAEKFARHGFEPFDCLRPRLWNASDVDWWYAQNTLLYINRRTIQNQASSLGLGQSTTAPLALVHPRNFLAKVSTLESVRSALDAERSTLASRLRAKARSLLGRTGS